MITLLCLVGVGLGVAGDVRQPSVAGSFYTDDPVELRTEIEELIERARTGVQYPPAKAIVVPHAGYVFSGPTAAKAFAFIQGRGYVTPQDIKSIGMDVLRHRVIISYEAEAEGKTSEDIIKTIFDEIEVP